MPAVFDYYPFDSGLGANSTESRWRNMMKNMLSTGVVIQGVGLDNDDCAVSAGTGMSVNISTGVAWVKGHMFEHTGTAANLAIANNSSGSTRTDLIVIRADFVNNNIQYLVLQGTTTPVQSSTVWDLPLATVAVPNGAASSASFTITDMRVSANHFTFCPATQLTNNSNFAVGASATVTLTWNIEQFDNMSMHSNTVNTDRITIVEAGLYQVSAMVYWRRTGAAVINGQMEMSLFQNRSSTIKQFARDSRYFSLSNGVQSVSQVIDLLPGDFLYCQVTNTTAFTDVVVDSAQPYTPYMTVVKLGNSAGV